MNIRKITATLTLCALISSSCQPIFADSDAGQDKKRQEALNELALHLSDKAVKLEDKEEELNKKEAGLEALSQKIHDKNVALTVREVELDDLKETISKGSVYLAANQKELERDKQLFASRKEEVERVAKEAEEKARQADEKSKMADERLVKARELDRTLAEKQKEVDDKLRQIDRDRTDILAKTTALDAASRDVLAKIESLELDRKKLEEAKGIYAEKQKELDGIINSLNAMTTERDNAVKEAADLRAEAAENMREIDRLIKMAEDQENTIAQLRDEISNKEKEVQAFYVSNAIVIPLNNNGGSINWSDGSIRATGKGVPRENTTRSQGKLLARRAAQLDLERNMLEAMQGVKIYSQTEMKDFAIEFDTVSASVKGVVSGIEIISEEWEEEWDDKTGAYEGTYTVVGQIRQEKLARPMNEVARHIPPAGKKLKSEGKKNGEKYTGLILDIDKSLRTEPKKFFRIVDENGYLVYGTDNADKNIQSRIGLCAYYKDRVFIKDEKARVGDNPLFIKAQRIASNGEDIVIATSDAETIRRNQIDFRKECKVIIVNHS